MKDVQDNSSSQTIRSLGRALPGQVVLVLQGGGALGSYQAGVYQALHEAGIEPDWIIGTSIGAINASLIAGNAPQDRLSRLQEFWKRMEQNPVWNFRGLFPGFNEKADLLVHGHQWNSRLLPAQSAGACRRRLPARRRQGRLLFDRAAGTDPERTRRFRSGQSLRAAADGRRRACPDQPDAVFRQPRRRAHRQAHHGVGRVAAGVSRRSHRRRIVLGRRHSVEHADGGGVRRQSAQGFADLRRASVESVGPRADHDGGGAQPAQGRAVFQPDREPHRATAAGASAASRHQPARRPAARGRAQQRGGA